MALVWTGTKSEGLSIVIAGAIAFAVIAGLKERMLCSEKAIVGTEWSEVDAEFAFRNKDCQGALFLSTCDE